MQSAFLKTDCDHQRIPWKEPGDFFILVKQNVLIYNEIIRVGGRNGRILQEENLEERISNRT